MNEYIDNSFSLKKWVESLTEEELILFLKSKTNELDGCWLFVGHLVDGYGVISKFGFSYRVHRLSLNVFSKLPYNSELLALHKLECPNRNCWNPEHLYVGTKMDNARDQLELGTFQGMSLTHCKRGHEFTVENTYIIKKKGNGRRTCRICLNAANKRARDKLKEQGKKRLRPQIRRENGTAKTCS